MSNVPSMYERVFVYSAAEAERLRKIHGQNVTSGTVSVRGVLKEYTSIILDSKDMPADGVIILKGDIRRIKYTPISYLNF